MRRERGKARRNGLLYEPGQWLPSISMAFGKWLAEHPPPDDAFTQSIAGAARRIAAREGLHPPVR